MYTHDTEREGDTNNLYFAPFPKHPQANLGLFKVIFIAEDSWAYKAKIFLISGS